jgi:hypothetical protein
MNSAIRLRFVLLNEKHVYVGPFQLERPFFYRIYQFFCVPWWWGEAGFRSALRLETCFSSF